MTFDSVTFWLFFPIAWAAWRWLPFGAARVAMGVASLVFYGWWDYRFVPLVFVSALIDYLIGGALHRSEEPGRRRGLVTLSIVCNLGLLGFFKYTPLVIRTAGGIVGAQPESAFFALWIVPVGISFYTFQTLSYTIDLYRREAQPATSFTDFLLYVLFFPQLVAGPIVRARTFLPQLERRQNPTAMRVRHGIYRCVQGLFLKVVVADGVAPAVIAAYQPFDVTVPGLSPFGAWYTAILFGVQIFADFAGYSGIAIGLASLLGLRFPENFRAPYIARSLSEFWTRWHISLSTWLRDYLYIPLGGNRHSALRTYRNLALVMLLGGLWHGASWNYVVWGGLHGVGLIVARLFGRRSAWRSGGLGAARPGVGEVRSRGASRVAAFGRVCFGFLSWALVFGLVHVAWVYFRVRDLGAATRIVEAMLVDPWRSLAGRVEGIGTRCPSLRYAWLVSPVVLMHLAQLLREHYGRRPSETLLAIATGAMLFCLMITERLVPLDFLYFQF